MELLSAVIITYNEEKNIASCLDSLKRVADEVIVLDGYSIDRTVEIARKKGAKVRQAYFIDYIQQKNAAIALTSNNFILSLDADEALDENLIKSILDVKKNFNSAAYSMNRCTNYCGKYIRKGTWYPDRKIRLFDKRYATWGGSIPHEKIVLDAGIHLVKHLQGDILHYSFPDIEKHIQKNDQYSTMSAKSMFERGKKSSWFKMLINPFWSFIHCYFIRLGFMDGFYGFVIAMNTAHGTFLKYSKLYQLQHKQKAANVFIHTPPAVSSYKSPVDKYQN